jgi:predicted porin
MRGYEFTDPEMTMFSKKTALATACMLAALSAQADVTVYGVLDMSFGSYQKLAVNPSDESVSSNRQTAVESGDMTSSFIGFKGEEDLGAGLKVVFNLESYVRGDTGAQGSDAFWGRNTHVGLSSNEFGTVTLGHTDTLYFQQAVAFNPFGASGQYSPTVRLAMLGAFGDQVGDLSDAYNLPITNLSQISLYGAGWSNAITYTTPDISGFVGGVQLGLKEDGAETQGRFAASGAYSAGPLGLSLVYANDKYAQGSKMTSVLGGASYDLGVAKLYGQIGQHTIKDAAALNGESLKFKFFQLGAGVPVTADGAVLVSLGQSKVTGSLKVRDFSIGYDQMLSKRTDAYVALRDERFSADGESVKQNALSAGVRHRF